MSLTCFLQVAASYVNGPSVNKGEYLHSNTRYQLIRLSLTNVMTTSRFTIIIIIIARIKI